MKFVIIICIGGLVLGMYASNIGTDKHSSQQKVQVYQQYTKQSTTILIKNPVKEKVVVESRTITISMPTIKECNTNYTSLHSIELPSVNSTLGMEHANRVWSNFTSSIQFTSPVTSNYRHISISSNGNTTEYITIRTY